MRKKSSTKQKRNKTEKDYTIRLTRKRYMLWMTVAFLSLIWMFTLGILVGRGLSPVHFDFDNINRKLDELKTELLNKSHVRVKIDTNSISQKPEFDFYKTLTEKKEEARIKSMLESQENAETTSTQLTYMPKEKKEDKTLIVNKESKIEPKDLSSFTIQVAALRSLDKANAMIQLLKKRGFEAYLTTVNIPRKGTWYRVRIGRFKDRDQARQILAKLRLYNLEGIIIHQLGEEP